MCTAQCLWPVYSQKPCAPYLYPLYNLIPVQLEHVINPFNKQSPEYNLPENTPSSTQCEKAETMTTQSKLKTSCDVHQTMNLATLTPWTIAIRIQINPYETNNTNCDK